MPPTGICILLSIATMMKWPLSKIDLSRAFLQTGAAKREVYVILPRECRQKSFYWLQRTSAYILFNANAKWQEQCDFVFLSMGLCQSRFVPQLFYAKKGSDLETIAVKMVDDVLITRKRNKVQNVLSSILLQYKLGIVVLEPG